LSGESCVKKGRGIVPQEPVTIYVVDDDESIRRALKRLLGSMGYRVLTFGSAEEFLEFNVGTGEGCLVLDIRLPGITGLELQDKLSSLGSTCPVIFITAHDSPQWRERAEKAGAVAYLKKPFQEQWLIAAIRRACGERV
jgi:FixJ family two-component response regulator